MVNLSFRGMLLTGCCLAISLLTSCSKTNSTTTESASNSETESSVSNQITEQEKPVAAKPETKDEIPVISFGNQEPTKIKVLKPASASPKVPTAADAEAIISHLKELQILLGTWRGITKKPFDGFKVVDETNWIWDFQTVPTQPALVMTSLKSPYYRNARMTYLLDQKKYQLTLKNVENKTSTFVGTFSVPIEDTPGDDKTMQRTYKLELTQVDAGEARVNRFVLNQRNNNRYLLEYYVQRGAKDTFFRVDTISTQRDGTSFAIKSEGYGEKTCIISGGLGTMTVSHAGKTYYVCCSGCKSAFEDDPEKWIARAEEEKKKSMKK